MFIRLQKHLAALVMAAALGSMLTIPVLAVQTPGTAIPPFQPPTTENGLSAPSAAQLGRSPSQAADKDDALTDFAGPAPILPGEVPRPDSGGLPAEDAVPGNADANDPDGHDPASRESAPLPPLQAQFEGNALHGISFLTAAYNHFGVFCLGDFRSENPIVGAIAVYGDAAVENTVTAVGSAHYIRGSLSAARPDLFTGDGQTLYLSPEHNAGLSLGDFIIPALWSSDYVDFSHAQAELSQAAETLRAACSAVVIDDIRNLPDSAPVWVEGYGGYGGSPDSWLLNIPAGSHITLTPTAMAQLQKPFRGAPYFLNFLDGAGADLSGTETVITITGDAVSLRLDSYYKYSSYSTTENSIGLVWNLPDATAVDWQRSNGDANLFFGHVLAPNATVVTGDGDLYGGVAARSFQAIGGGVCHTLGFDAGRVDPEPVPQTGTLTVSSTVALPSGVQAPKDHLVTLTVTGPDGYETLLTTADADREGNTYRWELDGLAAGAYSLTETVPDSMQALTIGDGIYVLDPSKSKLAETVEVAAGGTAAAGLQSWYALQNPVETRCNLVVNNTVTGLAVLPPDYTASFTLTADDGTIARTMEIPHYGTANGTFTGSVTFSDVKYGKYTLSEHIAHEPAGQKRTLSFDDVPTASGEIPLTLTHAQHTVAAVSAYQGRPVYNISFSTSNVVASGSEAPPVPAGFRFTLTSTEDPAQAYHETVTFGEGDLSDPRQITFGRKIPAGSYRLTETLPDGGWTSSIPDVTPVVIRENGQALFAGQPTLAVLHTYDDHAFRLTVTGTFTGDVTDMPDSFQIVVTNTRNTGQLLLSRGNALPQTGNGQYVWRLGPDSGLPNLADTYTLTATGYEAAGSVVTCEVSVNGGSAVRTDTVTLDLTDALRTGTVSFTHHTVRDADDDTPPSPIPDPGPEPDPKPVPPPDPAPGPAPSPTPPGPVPDYSGQPDAGSSSGGSDGGEIPKPGPETEAPVPPQAPEGTDHTPIVPLYFWTKQAGAEPVHDAATQEKPPVDDAVQQQGDGTGYGLLESPSALGLLPQTGTRAVCPPAARYALVIAALCLAALALVSLPRQRKSK